ncbi:uncharacterized protein Dwil_GK20690 [Drosophila willistoni]|uniref:DUF2569 domain-containing protein n=1 Tax=Drosophila willistoni TaxID=7260 RepID=B4MK32_DROWI|nr:uncharacterized protein LOC6638502 [Drosophila willistoni]EDW72471.1 uncharacterized protein Dwil_GK20690 [Drosophila willistoni]
MLERLIFLRIRIAGLAIGWLGCLFSFVMMVRIGIALAYGDPIADHFVVTFTPEEKVHMDHVIGSIGLVFFALNILWSGLLIAGIMKNRHLMLLPWLIKYGIALVVFISYNLHRVNRFIELQGSIDMLASLTRCGVGIVLCIYIYYGMFSLYKDIQKVRYQVVPVRK